LMDSCVVHLLNNTEFLREQCAYENVMNPDRIIIGQWCLSVLITFWNEVNELSKKLGSTTSEVARLVCADSRVSTYGTSKFGHPFGGRCLPMCMDELITAFRGEGLNPLLFEAVRTYNLGIQDKYDNT